jgi:hypothetical protein
MTLISHMANWRLYPSAQEPGSGSDKLETVTGGVIRRRKTPDEVSRRLNKQLRVEQVFLVEGPLPDLFRPSIASHCGLLRRSRQLNLDGECI